MGGSGPTGQREEDPWESEIDSLERAIACHSRDGCAIAFAGSSSIRLWATLERDMAPLHVVNIGFGGAHVDAILRYAPRILLPLHASAVVLYAGENDLEPHCGKSPEDVLRDLDLLAKLLEDGSPVPRLYVLSVKLSPARRESWPAVRRLNALLRDFCAAAGGRTFVDVAGPSLDARGEPRPELFAADGLHLSERGYELWTALLRPLLHSREAAASGCE
jgi:lysophospholipase L1-like esterase